MRLNLSKNLQKCTLELNNIEGIFFSLGEKSVEGKRVLKRLPELHIKILKIALNRARPPTTQVMVIWVAKFPRE